MSAQKSERGRIVVAVDGSPTSHDALKWAVHEARIHGDALEVVHAWSYPPTEFALPVEEFGQQASRILEEAVEEARSMDSQVAVEGVLRQGPPVSTILELSKGADLLVVGSRGLGGFSALLLGSVSQQLAQHADCSVAIVR